MLWDLIGDVIPWTSLVTHTVDGVFYFGLRGYTALTTRGFDHAVSVLSGVDLEE
jgi:hypothetical protein